MGCCSQWSMMKMHCSRCMKELFGKPVCFSARTLFLYFFSLCSI